MVDVQIVAVWWRRAWRSPLMCPLDKPGTTLLVASKSMYTMAVRLAFDPPQGVAVLQSNASVFTATNPGELLDTRLCVVVLDRPTVVRRDWICVMVCRPGLAGSICDDVVSDPIQFPGVQFTIVPPCVRMRTGWGRWNNHACTMAQRSAYRDELARVGVDQYDVCTAPGCESLSAPGTGLCSVHEFVLDIK